MENFNMTGQIRWGTLHSVPYGVRFRWGTRLSASMVPLPMHWHSRCGCGECQNTPKIQVGVPDIHNLTLWLVSC